MSFTLAQGPSSTWHLKWSTTASGVMERRWVGCHVKNLQLHLALLNEMRTFLSLFGITHCFADVLAVPTLCRLTSGLWAARSWRWPLARRPSLRSVPAWTGMGNLAELLVNTSIPGLCWRLLWFEPFFGCSSFKFAYLSDVRVVWTVKLWCVAVAEQLWCYFS